MAFTNSQPAENLHFFYALTKINKPNPVGRAIISGCKGLTERLSNFVDKLLQPITHKTEIISQRYNRFHIHIHIHIYIYIYIYIYIEK